MADATIITEVPPLRACYARIGQQAVVPIWGTHRRRVIFGALNIRSGSLQLLITTHWEALTWQAFLRQIRRAWRGWRIVLFADRGSPHTAEDSRASARALGIELRLLPVATPELNAVEGLWREAKDQHLANRSTDSMDDTADAFCQYLLDLSPRQRLHKAGVLSGHFWLMNSPSKNFTGPT
jgi:transposase